MAVYQGRVSEPDYTGVASRRQYADLGAARQQGLNIVQSRQRVDLNAVALKNAAADLALRKQTDPMKIETERLRMEALKHDRMVKDITQSRAKMEKLSEMQDLDNAMKMEKMEEEKLGREAAKLVDKQFMDSGIDSMIASGDAEGLARLHSEMRSRMGLADYNLAMRYGSGFSVDKIKKAIVDTPSADNFARIYRDMDREQRLSIAQGELLSLSDEEFLRRAEGDAGALISADQMKDPATFGQNVNEELTKLQEQISNRAQYLPVSDPQRLVLIEVARNLDRMPRVLREIRDSPSGMKVSVFEPSPGAVPLELLAGGANSDKSKARVKMYDEYTGGMSVPQQARLLLNLPDKSRTDPSGALRDYESIIGAYRALAEGKTVEDVSSSWGRLKKARRLESEIQMLSGNATPIGAGTGGVDASRRATIIKELRNAGRNSEADALEASMK